MGRWQWGSGDGLHAESVWEVLRSAPLEVVSADIHSPAPIPKEGLCRHSPCQGGWIGIVAVMSLIPSDMQVLVVKAKKCQG